MLSIRLRIAVPLLCLLAGFGFSCHRTEVRLEPGFETYIPKDRVGVGKISIERRRIIQYFGFKDVSSFAAIDMRVIASLGGIKNKKNDITLKVVNGRIVDRPVVTGTEVPDVDEYIQQVAQRWFDAQGTEGARFTEFIDKVEFVVKIDQGGTFQVIFQDLEVSQPKDARKEFQFFNTVSTEPGKMHYLVPLKGFKIASRDGVRKQESARKKFEQLSNKLEEWKKRKKWKEKVAT